MPAGGSTLADEIADAIVSNAQSPKTATGDAGSVTAHSLKEQIEADQYLAGKAAVAAKAWPLRMKFVAPGPV
jgi:hypothetical protein